MATPQYLLKRKPTLIRLEKRGQEVLSNFVVAKGIKREISASQKGYTDIGNQDKRFHCDPEQQRQQLQQQQHIQQQQHQQLLKQKQQEHQIQQLQQKQLQHHLLKHYQAKQEQQATGSQSQPEVAGNENAPFQKGPQVLYQMKVLPNGTLQQVIITSVAHERTTQVPGSMSCIIDSIEFYTYFRRLFFAVSNL
jgi:hypothetical protein